MASSSASRVSRREMLGRMLAGSVPAAGGLSALLSSSCTSDGGEGSRRNEEKSGKRGSREAGSDDGGQGDGGRGDGEGDRDPDPTGEFDGRSPLTGKPIDEPAPVLAAKIDNVAAARPHRGIGAADVVYVEPVEAGLSRLLAVFSSRLPRRLGPIRSARESDVSLLRQFGRPALAYSGANEVVDRLLADAPLALLPPARAGRSYERDPDRSPPHNLYADARSLLSGDRAAGVSKASDIGFRFGPPTHDPGRPVERLPVEARTVTYDAFELEVRADRVRGRWQLVMDGEPYAVEPPTVVIQRVEARASAYDLLRRLGSGYIETVGEGEATVLRGGQAYVAHWSRPTPRDGTTFRGADGNVIDFTSGQVWIVYDAS